MGKTALKRLEELKKDIYSQYGFWGEPMLLDSVQRARAEPEPGGSVEEIEKRAAVLRDTAQECEQQRKLIQVQIKAPLSAAWTGPAAEGAEASLGALDSELRRASEVFDEAARALNRLATALHEARRMHQEGRGRLLHAQGDLISMLSFGPSGYESGRMKEAHHNAMAGISTMVKAAHHLKGASHAMERQLGELSSRAHAARVKIHYLSNLERLLVSDAAVPGTGPHDANLILTADASTRAGDRLYEWDTADQGRFGALLRDSRSPHERAYLVQALAAGYSLKRIQDFDRKIHAHGNDPLWLQCHLTPVAEIAGPDPLHSHRPVEFEGRAWAQGSEPTCVAMSTIMARAQVDPLYALQLTTGGHPDDPAHDNGDAFARRLHDEQHRVYDDGRNWLQDLFGQDGMTDGQARDAVNDEVGSRTGARYDEVPVDSAADRRTVLADIDKAVDDGLPVTFSVEADGRGHEMAIVGRRGDMLEVYNPWGYTVWVSEDDFVNDRMNVIENGVPSQVHVVNVPRR